MANRFRKLVRSAVGFPPLMLVVALPLVASVPGHAVGQSALDTPRVNLWQPRSLSAQDATVFWFGRATEQDNYVDVRVTHDNDLLLIYAEVVDYYLWTDSSGTSDPRDYDSIALYIDTDGTASGGPQASSYLFVSGFRGSPVANDSRWHRQARGSGGVWDATWQPPTNWTDAIDLRYSASGPNNDSDRDAGWLTALRLPWSTFGLSGPPPADTVWRIGVRLYDRDRAPGSGAVATTAWPTALADSSRETWGELAFSPAPDPTPSVSVTGTTEIRRGVNGSIVADAYAGGGGNCGGGIFGGGDQPHPTDQLFVQNQYDVSDFPCFSKSFVKFDLSSVPTGKTIISATLTLHSFGGSDPAQAKPSNIHLFSVSPDWDENTLTWNNTPLAKENISSATVGVLPGFPGWPGAPSNWDATRAVAEAYAGGKPVSLALYSSDTEYHSGKYFSSSDTGDWNVAARPALTIAWGEPADGTPPSSVTPQSSVTPRPSVTPQASPTPKVGLTPTQFRYLPIVVR